MFDYIIIGAGPGGLGLAYRLLKITKSELLRMINGEELVQTMVVTQQK